MLFALRVFVLVGVHQLANHLAEHTELHKAATNCEINGASNQCSNHYVGP